jgi:2-amino-4-hydroxy-6-hydroxymethyldihydropteridine diphosphokinase
MVKALDEWTTVYIALGSNLYNKEENMSKAINFIEGLDNIRLVKQSGFLATKAEGFHSDNDFLNAVVQVDCKMYPENLLRELLAIEQQMGRERKEPGYSDRPIDLDIIAFGNMVYKSRALTLPHPEMHKRRFVLQPLCDIAPTWIHPKLNIGAEELLRLIQNEG